MRYRIQKDGEVLLVTLHGSVWGLIEDYQVKDEIKIQVEAGASSVLLDFKDVNRVNSIGIGIVISSMASTRAANGQFKACGMNQRVHAAFEVTGVLRVLEIHPDQTEAMKSFNA